MTDRNTIIFQFFFFSRVDKRLIYKQSILLSSNAVFLQNDLRSSRKIKDMVNSRVLQTIKISFPRPVTLTKRILLDRVIDEKVYNYSQFLISVTDGADTF